jgi:hypothetical protein
MKAGAISKHQQNLRIQSHNNNKKSMAQRLKRRGNEIKRKKAKNNKNSLT